MELENNIDWESDYEDSSSITSYEEESEETKKKLDVWVGEMLQEKRHYAEWFIFHEQLHSELKLFFKRGGTVEMLDGNQPGKALYHAINEDSSEKSYKLMMENGAKPNRDVWSIFLDNQCEHRNRWCAECINDFLSRGFLPQKEYLTDSLPYIKEIITIYLCRKSVFYVLFIAKTSKQPMSYMWKIIAKCLYNTRKDLIWLELL